MSRGTWGVLGILAPRDLGGIACTHYHKAPRCRNSSSSKNNNNTVAMAGAGMEEDEKEEDDASSSSAGMDVGACEDKVCALLTSFFQLYFAPPQKQAQAVDDDNGCDGGSFIGGGDMNVETATPYRNVTRILVPHRNKTAGSFYMHVLAWQRRHVPHAKVLAMPNGKFDMDIFMGACGRVLVVNDGKDPFLNNVDRQYWDTRRIHIARILPSFASSATPPTTRRRRESVGNGVGHSSNNSNKMGIKTGRVTKKTGKNNKAVTRAAAEQRQPSQPPPSCLGDWEWHDDANVGRARRAVVTTSRAHTAFEDNVATAKGGEVHRPLTPIVITTAKALDGTHPMTYPNVNTTTDAHGRWTPPPLPPNTGVIPQVVTGVTGVAADSGGGCVELTPLPWFDVVYPSAHATSAHAASAHTASAHPPPFDSRVPPPSNKMAANTGCMANVLYDVFDGDDDIYDGGDANDNAEAFFFGGDDNDDDAWPCALT